MKRIFLLIISLIFIGSMVQAAEEAVQKGPAPDLTLGWPYNLQNEKNDYVMEMIFNPKVADKYVLEAKKCYWKGYKLIQKYQGVQDAPDPFLRDPYKVFSQEMWNNQWKMDFSQAFGWFNKGLEIYIKKLQFDEYARSIPEYKENLGKILKGMVYASVYVHNLFAADKYLDLYIISFPDDKAYYLPWKIRILSLIIERQDQYNIGYSGALSADSFKKRYKEYLIQYLDMQKDLGAKTRQYIIDSAIPSFTTQTFDNTTLNTNFIK